MRLNHLQCTGEKTMRIPALLPAFMLAGVLVWGILSEAAYGAAAEQKSAAGSSMEEINAALEPQVSEDFYRTTYEVFVYSFCDSDGDGTGDLQGLLSRLDYINDGDPATAEDLGCTALWLMPVFPSPTYHKYDTVDYKDIDPEYGTLADMDELLEACHTRNIRVILDLAVNHTSSQHPWFQRAAEYLRSLPEGEEPSPAQCPETEYYHFSREGGDGFAQLPGSAWFYEARFWSEMPDLNLDCPAVRQELADVLRFWLERGVDGFRLDAVPYYYTDSREASVAFTGWLTETAKAIRPDAYLVAEAWTDQDSYAAFYRSGIDSMFDFAFANREGIIARVAEGSLDVSAWAEAMEAEESLYASLNPAYINAPFYTNHDMGRGAGYYNDKPLKRGEKRTAGAGGESASRTKLAEALNLLMTGNAFLYYGEELGMRGSGKDENKRAPMYWSEDPEAAGVCAGPPDMDEIEMKFGSWETQRQDPWSVYSYVRQAVRIRESLPVLARGKTRVLPSLSEGTSCGFLRSGDDLETVLVLVNAGTEETVLELPEEASAYRNLRAALLSADGEIRREENTVTLPAFGIAFFTAE